MSFSHVSGNNNYNNGDLISRSRSIPNMRHVNRDHNTNNFNNNNNNNNDNTNNNSSSNTNKLQSFLSQQEQNSSQININNNNITNDQSGNATTTTTTTTTSANFYTITQYILQSYYKVDFNTLIDLKLIDLIVDQTYPDSLTLRKLNDADTLQTYQYFNTISRDTDISRCPIFALSVYFVIRWSHPNPPITVDNFKEIKLLDPNHITYDSNPMMYIQNHLNGNVNSTTKIPRSTIFEPSEHLINLVFPWLYTFKQDVLSNDRTNYTLHSLCELFEFMGKIIIQDLRYLNQHALLLPNIVTFMSKFIPELLEDNEFKGFEDSNNTVIQGGSNNDGTTHLLNNTNSNIQLNSSVPPQATNTNIPNDILKMQVFDQANDKLQNYMDNKFIELSRKLTTENIRLSQQVAQLKSDVSSLSSMCSQMIQLQRQMISGQNAVLASNKESNENTNANNTNNDDNNNSLPGINNGILIIDKNSVNDESFKTLIDSLRGNNNISDLNTPQENINQAHTPINTINTKNNNNSNLPNSSVLAPIKVIPNLNNSNIQTTTAQVIQSISSPKQPSGNIASQTVQSNPSSKLPQTTSPQPVINPSPRASALVQSITHLSSGPKEKRKLPLPQNNRDSIGSIGSPFSANSPGSLSGIESPFPKRVRLDEKPTPSQTALDSLLFKSISTPGAQVKVSPAAELHHTLTSGDISKKPSTTFLVDGSSSSDNDMENASDFPNNNDDEPVLAIQSTSSAISGGVHTPMQTLVNDETPQTKLNQVMSAVSLDRNPAPFDNIPDSNDTIGKSNKGDTGKDNANKSTNVGGNFQILTGQTLPSINATSTKLQKIDEIPLALDQYEGQNKGTNSFQSTSVKPITTAPADKKTMMRVIKEFTVVQSKIGKSLKSTNAGNSAPKEKQLMKVKGNITPQPKKSEITPHKTGDSSSSSPSKTRENSDSQLDKKASSQSKVGPNENIKYKLSRENKTIWDLYAEWYIGINGKPPIKQLIDEYGWRRWKVTEDSHFFPTRKIIIQYIDTECDRGLELGRFSKDQSREEIRRIIVSDMEKFRINNSLTLNSLSLYFRNLTKKHKEICIFKDFTTWQTKKMTHVEKTKYSKRKHTAAEVARDLERSARARNTIIPLVTNVSSIPVISFKQHRIYNIQPMMTSGLRNAPTTGDTVNTTVLEQTGEPQAGESSQPVITQENNPTVIEYKILPKNDNKLLVKETTPKEPTEESSTDVNDQEKTSVG